MIRSLLLAALAAAATPAPDAASGPAQVTIELQVVRPDGSILQLECRPTTPGPQAIAFGPLGARPIISAACDERLVPIFEDSFEGSP